MLLAAWLGCAAAELPVDDVPVSVADLWSGVFSPGTATLGPVVVTSPRTLAGGSFYVQDPGGGPATGLQVRVTGFQLGVPPPPGTEVAIVGAWTVDLDGVPSLEIDDDTDVVVGALDQAVGVLPRTGALEERGSPVALGEVTVSSAVDPSGGADLATGVQIVGAFGVFPGGWDERAVASGIAVGPEAVAPRDADDWVVVAPAREPETADLAAVSSLPEGRPVRVEGVQAAPWSVDRRWTALQSGADGLWIDAEGWGLVGAAEGDVATWEGEVRRGTDGLRLRVWTEPTIAGTAEVVTAETLAEGARVAIAVSGIGEPDAFGVRAADPVPLDDRFGALDALPDPALATGIVRTGADGALQLAPFAWE